MTGTRWTVSDESSNAATLEGGDVRQATQEQIEHARHAIRSALLAYGPNLDDVTRELLSAADALDRARKRLRERGEAERAEMRRLYEGKR